MTYADLIVRGARVLAFDDGAASARSGGATTVASRAGRIVAVGGDEVAASWRGPRTQVHEYPGAAVLPGLVDAHAHPVWGSLSRGTGVDLAAVHTLAALRSAVAEGVAARRAGAWVDGFGLDLAVFDGRPDGRVLEEWFPGVPISLMTKDAHALVVSPAVVDAAGITGREVFADASAVVCDAQGRPTGWLVELQAMDLALDAAPRLPLDEQADVLLETLQHLAAGGLTGLHALDLHEPSEQLFRLLEERTELPLRIRASPLVPADSAPPTWEQVAAQVGRSGRRWQVAGVKFMLDGTADNGTAWFEHPDELGENQRSLWRSTEAFREAVRFFTDRGIATTTHAIGDQAVRFTLDVVAEVGHPPSGPHRIEHIESIPDDLLPRFAATGVVAGLQPTHGTRLTNPDRSDPWSLRLGPERAGRGWRVRDLLDHGAVVALSSDWPIGVGDPRISLADAQVGRRYDDPADGGPARRPITAVEAYRAMTLGPAIAAGLGDAGRVAPGGLADLTVLADDPTTLDPAAQAVNPVLATYVDGTRVELTRRSS